MVEAMMSDSDEEDFMKAEDDDYGEDNINSIQNMSPSKKVLNRITKFYDDNIQCICKCACIRNISIYKYISEKKRLDRRIQ